MPELQALSSRSRERTGYDTVMGAEVKKSLASDPPSLPSKYFYDDRGSRLFEQITRLPEYYQTNTEEHLLLDLADDIAQVARPRELVELGSGSGKKVRLLLDGLQRNGLLGSLVLFDINRSFLRDSAETLSEEYAGLSIDGVVGDFMQDLEKLGAAGKRMIVFLGGTIGNIHPDDVPAFLWDIRQALLDDGTFLLGVDTVKDRSRLESAYNDTCGVTARFNLNILRVVNRKLGADFPVDDFEHVAFWDDENSWIEMRLRAVSDMQVSIPGAGLRLELTEGEEIRTEISCKYTRESFCSLLDDTGFDMSRWYTDPEDLFALTLLRAA